jgi:copper transport protein
VALAAGWLTLSAGAAEAHPELIGAEPPPGSVLSRTPDRVRLVFSESVEPAGAEVLLETAAGEPVARGGNTSPGALELTPPSLATGVYEVQYRALGRDGHLVSGTYRLAVWPPGAPRPAGLDSVARTSGGPRGASPQGRARGIAIALTVPLAGVLLASSVLGSPGLPEAAGARLRRMGAGSRLRRMGAVAAAAGIVAADAVAVASAGRGAVSTTFGRLVIAHAALAVAGSFLAFRPAGPAAGSRFLRAVAGGALLLPVTLAGHDVVLSTRPAAAGILDWVHLTAASLWVGGVIHVLTPGPDDPNRDRWRGQARRLAPFAVASGAVVVLTGTMQAAARVHRVDALADTAYGRTLCVKVLLVAAVAALGLVARLRARRSGSRRLFAGEAAAFAGVLASVAVLVSLPPPAPPPPPPSGPLLTAALVGDRLLSVLVTPYRPGANTVRIAPAAAAGLPPATPPRVWAIAGGIRQPLTPAPSWEAPLSIPAQGTVRLRIESDTGSWEGALSPQDPRRGKAIRIGSVVSLGGPGAEECRSRLAGQLVAVEETDVGRRGTPFALEAVEAGSNAADVLRSRGVAALVGACPGSATDPPRLARQLGVPRPADPLAAATDPTAAGRVFASFLAQQRVKRAALVVDGGDPGRRLATAFAAQGSASGLETVTVPAAAPSAARDADVVVVAAGWDASRAVLATARSQGWKPERGIFLAPWLLHTDILRATLGGPTQVSIGLAVDPVSDGARRYLGALSALAPAEPATVEGLAGYLEARAALATVTSGENPASGPAAARREATSATFPIGTARGGAVRIQFFTPTDIEFLPAFLGDHGAAAHAWLGDAGLAAVSGVLADRG